MEKYGKKENYKLKTMDENIEEAVEDCNNEAIFACIHYWCGENKKPKMERILWFINLQLRSELNEIEIIDTTCPNCGAVTHIPKDQYDIMTDSTIVSCGHCKQIYKLKDIIKMDDYTKALNFLKEIISTYPEHKTALQYMEQTLHGTALIEVLLVLDLEKNIKIDIILKTANKVWNNKLAFDYIDELID